MLYCIVLDWILLVRFCVREQTELTTLEGQLGTRRAEHTRLKTKVETLERSCKSLDEQYEQAKTTYLGALFLLQTLHFHFTIRYVPS